jgi:succinate dehydrogenase/fumarate reductase flavoprotein subunit
MHKNLLTVISAGVMTLFLVTACAEENADVSSQTLSKNGSSSEKVSDPGDQGNSLMNQPVNFSTPEDVEKTLQNIREKEGDKAHNQLKIAMQYIMVYDLSVGNNKEKMYKKLDGRTPEQIIAKMKR